MKPKTPSSSGNLVLLGKILQEWGIRGQVRFLSFNPQSALYPELKSIYVAESEGRVLEIEQVKRHGRYWLMKFKGFANPESARALRGLNLGLPRDQLPDPESDELYLSDLEGLRVKANDDRELGVVVGFLHVGEGEVLRIETKQGGEILIPYQKEFVQATDRKTGWIQLTALAEDLL